MRLETHIILLDQSHCSVLVIWMAKESNNKTSHDNDKLPEKICKRLYTSLQTKIEATNGWNYFIELHKNGTNTAIRKHNESDK